MATSSDIVVKSFDELVKEYDPSKNQTMPTMTKFELAKILGQRMEQLARGAPTLIDVSKENFGGLANHEKFKRIAELEIRQRVLPFMIGRTLPNGAKEYWKLSDMIIPGY